jgi:hypothetical protein
MNDQERKILAQAIADIEEERTGFAKIAEKNDKQAEKLEIYEKFIQKLANGLSLTFTYMEKNKLEGVNNSEDLLKQAFAEPDKVIPEIFIKLANRANNIPDEIGIVADDKMDPFSGADPFDLLATQGPGYVLQNAAQLLDK